VNKLTVEEIVESFELDGFTTMGRTHILIASWRERGEALKRAHAYIEMSYAPGSTDWREGVLHGIDAALASESASGEATHGSPELDEDAAKLAAMGADPGPTFADVQAQAESPAGMRDNFTDDEIAAAFVDQRTLDRVLDALDIANTDQDPAELIVQMIEHIADLRSTKATEARAALTHTGDSK
jgi:hypothetical protein